MSREKALKYNMLTTLLSEIVILVSGLIMPRIILLYFGSATNGLVASISQFLGFAVVLRAGLGGAVRVALYRPIADNDNQKISAIMAATNDYMRKVALITGGLIMVFAFVYPFFVADEYEWWYAFAMVLIIGFGTFADSFWGIKCKILLQADQKYYITILSATASHILVTITSIIMMVSGFSIMAMKFAAVFVALIDPLILNIYVKKHYRLDSKCKPDNGAIKQRWSAFFQQLAAIVNQNVDLVLLTWMVSLKEISVYTVHFMVASNIGKIVNSCTTGINSTFGDFYVRNEKEQLKKSLFFIEWLVFAVGTLLYAVTAVMITPFIRLYTASITDVNYIRPMFALVMVVSIFINTVKTPYQLLCEGIGRFRETRNGAIAEVIINIVLSVIFIKFFGIIGVLMGTFVAALIRTLEYCIYSSKHIISIGFLHFFKHFTLLTITFAACFLLGNVLTSPDVTNYFIWCVNGVITVGISFAIILVVSFLFYREQLKTAFGKIKKR